MSGTDTEDGMYPNDDMYQNDIDLEQSDGEPLLSPKQESKELRNRIIISLLVLCIVALGFHVIIGIIGPAAKSRKVILISFDGFRWDYSNRTSPINLMNLMDKGIHSRLMVPVFPSLTFPNHYTLVTGLYPESHGIVANTMFDPTTNKSFSLGNSEAVTSSEWWRGEPIWVTAKKWGLKVGVYFWPGSEAEIKGMRPDIYEVFNDSISNFRRVRTVLDWITEDAMDLALLYFSDVDHEGHDFGPDSSEVDSAVHRVDEALGELLVGLRDRGQLENTDIIVVADHGMTAVDYTTRQVSLEDHVDVSTFRLAQSSPITLIFPSEDQGEGLIDELYANLSNVEHFSIYYKKDIPPRFHFQSSPRISPLVGVAELGWSVTRTRSASTLKGMHGYDNLLEDMGALFAAMGPSFKPTKVPIDTLSNLEIYPLLCHALGISPAANNGSIQTLLPYLQRRDAL